MSRLRLIFSMFALAFALQAFCPTLSWADDDDHEGEEVPETSEPKQENPIERILEMMREVEDRLIDSDSGEWTQQEEEAKGTALRAA